MILTIAIVLASLVALNFLLLIFSCNKTPKKVDKRVPPYLKVKKTTTLKPNRLDSGQLAPTGS
jgi:hypothetical protein